MEDKIVGLFTGKPKPLGKTLSAIRKDSVQELMVDEQGIKGDDVYDKKHHGGPKRVIHHYSLRNYRLLKKAFPDLANKFKAGSYGENLCSENLTEENLCIGDVFQLGEVRGRLTIPRSPCATIDATYESKGILKNILSTGHFGWFYEVIETGVIKANQHIKLVDRPYPKLNLHQIILQCFKKLPADNELLEQALEVNILDDSWTKKVNRLL